MISENHSGIVWTLMALIVLTLSGVFLSLLVDKRLSFSSARNSQARLIAENEALLLALRGELDVKTVRLSARHGDIESATTGIGDRGARFREMESRNESLRKKKAELPAAIRELEKAFADYRAEYRKAEWRDAAGERIDSLFLKNGRHFQRVIIHRVTPAGLEITHSRGSALIDSGDLGSDYTDRFQWDEGERAAFLAKGSERRAENPVSAPPAAEAPSAAPDEAAIADLRKEISLWRARVSSLKAEYSEAARHESRRSVPGSLRTWGEQAAILRAAISRAEAGLALATGKLRAISPNDPVLAIPR